MSQENVEIVLRFIADYEEDDRLVAWLDTLDPEIEWKPFEEGTPSYGHDGAKRLRQSWLETWAEHRFDVEEVLDDGDHVVASIRIRAKGLLSGVSVEFPQLYVHFRLRDGRIVYIFEHQNRSEALEAAGLPDNLFGKVPFDLERPD